MLSVLRTLVLQLPLPAGLWYTEGAFDRTGEKPFPAEALRSCTEGSPVYLVLWRALTPYFANLTWSTRLSAVGTYAPISLCLPCSSPVQKPLPSAPSVCVAALRGYQHMVVWGPMFSPSFPRRLHLAFPENQDRNLHPYTPFAELHVLQVPETCSHCDK